MPSIIFSDLFFMRYCRFTVLPSLFISSVFFLSMFFHSSIAAETNFCSENKSDQVIFCLDFEQNDTGIYTSKQLIKDWPNLETLSTKITVLNLGVTQQRVKIQTLENNKLMKIFYPKDTYGPWLTGATWKMRLPGLKEKESYEQISLEYKVMFKEGFLYDREGLFGGKLPGLMGGENISGGAKADGRNGWTARLMWGQLGRGLGYVYYPDMNDDKYNQKACPRYGLDHELCVIKRNKYFSFENDSNRKCLSEWASDDFEFRFKTERFYKIKQLIKMNTLPVRIASADNDTIPEGNRDGIIKIWLDDKLVLDCNNMRFRDIPELAIDSLMFSTFFGGNTPESSAHHNDEYIYFDDFIVRND